MSVRETIRTRADNFAACYLSFEQAARALIPGEAAIELFTNIETTYLRASRRIKPDEKTQITQQPVLYIDPSQQKHSVALHTRARACEDIICQFA